jgi:hypothetical protein
VVSWAGSSTSDVSPGKKLSVVVTGNSVVTGGDMDVLSGSGMLIIGRK